MQHQQHFAPSVCTHFLKCAKLNHSNLQQTQSKERKKKEKERHINMANWERRQWLQRRWSRRRSVAPKFALCQPNGKWKWRGMKRSKREIDRDRKTPKTAVKQMERKTERKRLSVSLSLLLLIKNGFKRELQRRQLKAAAAHCFAHCGEERKIAKRPRGDCDAPLPQIQSHSFSFFNHSREKNGAKREQLWQLWKKNHANSPHTDKQQQPQRNEKEIYCCAKK